jgi:hypothetical protein
MVVSHAAPTSDLYAPRADAAFRNPVVPHPLYLDGCTSLSLLLRGDPVTDPTEGTHLSANRIPRDDRCCRRFTELIEWIR